MSLVSFVKVARDNEIGKAIQDSLDLIQYKLPSNAKNIVIKPNMCYYWDYTTGQTTDPKFVAALIDLLRKKVASLKDIFILESDASAMKCKYAFKILGYEKLAEDCNVKLVNLSEDKSDPIKARVGGHSFHLMMPRTIQKADLKINVPKVKYMARPGASITCALKNIYGCNPYPKKSQYHSKLAEAIVAMNKVMKFDVCVTDGIIVSGMAPCRLGLIMASKDPVALDAAAAKIAAENPRKIRYLQLAHKEGLGNITFAEKGEPLDYFKARYPKKNMKTRLLGKAYSLAVHAGLSSRLGLE